MTNSIARTTSALLSLLTAVAAVSAVTVAAPVKAEPRQQALNDRVAERCTASDVDLVGKRLARECRLAVRAQWQEEQRIAAARLAEPTIKVAERR